MQPEKDHKAEREDRHTTGRLSRCGDLPAGSRLRPSRKPSPLQARWRLFSGYAGTVSDTGAIAMGATYRPTAIGFVSAFSRLPVHPANMKTNNRAIIRISKAPCCSKVAGDTLVTLSRELAGKIQDNPLFYWRTRHDSNV